MTALKAVQNLRNAQNLQALYKAMHNWRTNEPKEFANRGGPDGVAYRLWMEAKQTLKNLFHRAFPESDPPKPATCPGDLILGIYVPEGEGHTEICHGFAYRWVIAAGK